MFGHQEGVNGVDPARIGRFYRYDLTAGGLTNDGALVDEGFAEEHGLHVGSTLDAHRDQRQELALEVSGIEKSPVLDVLGFGPVTIPQAAFDRTFEQRRNRLDLRGRRVKLTRFPNAKVEGKDAFIEARRCSSA